jgi:anti-anti-sigma regulatory factor
MTTAGVPVLFEVDGELVIDALRAAGEKLDGASGEVVLDFSSVRRVDPSALKAMEDLAGSADDKAVKVVLRGVNVNVYKVLKLARLAPRFSFVA